MLPAHIRPNFHAQSDAMIANKVSNYVQAYGSGAQGSTAQRSCSAQRAECTPGRLGVLVVARKCV